MTDNIGGNFKYNFKQRILNLKVTWKQQQLSPKGKITVLNDLAFALIIYVSSFVNNANNNLRNKQLNSKCL